MVRIGRKKIKKDKIKKIKEKTNNKFKPLYLSIPEEKFGFTEEEIKTHKFHYRLMLPLMRDSFSKDNGNGSDNSV